MIAAAIVSTMSCGVSLGASRPLKVATNGLGSVSTMVGTSGRCFERCLLLMPSGFTLSELMNGLSSTGLADTICTWPPTRSVNAGPTPR